MAKNTLALCQAGAQRLLYPTNARTSGYARKTLAAPLLCWLKRQEEHARATYSPATGETIA
ncbi:hypothetical protein A4S02_02865 [Acetobacter ascendens]|uniref:Uncharacterized protein n=1 Tax=Acetobacter ascendens TaxID=481146 RepID=A0A1D8QU83_9PROT|nr:hypothetical protein A4S02_02865 [Acetobacter ascendens]AOW50087.1 hypothetical protein A4R89_12465 [Acetobacter ascendens]